jgi:hypothetical protein
VSVQTILYRFKDVPVKGLARMIAVLCKKDGETLSDFNVDERERLFMGLPMSIGKDVEGFFLHSLRAYRSITLLYSVSVEQEELIRYKLQELRDIMKKREGQVGIFSFTRFRIMYYRMYLWYLSRELERYFSFTHIDSSKKNSKEIVKK